MPRFGGERFAVLHRPLSFYVDRYFPRDFFTVITNWFYFIDKCGVDEKCQLYRTDDDRAAQMLSNFS